jgi:low temperature requirement protein LtrA
MVGTTRVTRGRPAKLLRKQTGPRRVTNIELFFDLVFVFAVTQLSHTLLAHLSVEGALQTALLLAMVWLLWVYTTWVTNWLDPERIPVRLMLLGLMLAGLVMSAALPRAFAGLGLVVGGAYAVMQVGRSAFTMYGLRDEPLQRNFQRILSWCLVSGMFAVLGGLAHGHVRELLWLTAVTVDLLGGVTGFFTPGLGRSTTHDWTIDGNHFAERCQAFVLIALGESVIVIGVTLSDLPRVGVAEAAAFLVAFVGSVAFWWLYFDRSAEEGMQVVARSEDPGRLGRSAYHLIHPIMIAGIIVAAAADERVLSHPGGDVDTGTAALVLGGTALFLAGHAAFKAIVWRVTPWNRLIAILVLAAIGPIAPLLSAVVLGGAAACVALAVAVTDWSDHPTRRRS